MDTVANASPDSSQHEVVGFAIIPNWMTRDPSITPIMRAVYVTVAGHCGQYGTWEISQQTLADEVGVTARTIQRALGALRDLGVIAWDPPADPTRGCAYHLITPPTPVSYPPRHQCRTPPDTGVVPPTTPVSYIEEPLEEPLEEHPPTPRKRGDGATTVKALPKADETFDRFWEIYPRRTGKGRSRRAWATAIKKTTPEVILAALREQLPALAMQLRTDGNFIPYPASWLNAERWLDELTLPLEDEWDGIPEAWR